MSLDRMWAGFVSAPAVCHHRKREPQPGGRGPHPPRRYRLPQQQALQVHTDAHTQAVTTRHAHLPPLVSVHLSGSVNQSPASCWSVWSEKTSSALPWRTTLFICTPVYTPCMSSVSARVCFITLCHKTWTFGHADGVFNLCPLHLIKMNCFGMKH